MPTYDEFGLEVEPYEASGVSVAEAYDSVHADDASAFDTFRARWDEFSQLWPQFLAQEEYARMDPELSQEFDFITTYAGSVINSAQWILEQIGAAGEWFSNAFGMNGIGRLFDQKKGLGVLPAVGVAVVAGASAALVYLIDRIYAFFANGRLLEIKRGLVEAGQAPASILDTPEPPGLFGEVSGLIKWALIGAAAVFLLPEIIKRG